MPKLPLLTPYQSHVAKWSACRACELCDQRSKVVHVRGRLPCEILYVGEAPGVSEDVLGRPFVGPAGKLLDEIVSLAYEGVDHASAFCNLVGCYPKVAKKAGTNEPSDASIKACRPRLAEIVAMVRPNLIVCVGRLASKWVTKFEKELRIVETPRVDVTHPAAILRATDSVSRDHQVQTAVVRIRTAIEDAGLVPF